jgi:hypothetical protein
MSVRPRAYVVRRAYKRAPRELQEHGYEEAVRNAGSVHIERGSVHRPSDAINAC